MRKIVEKIGYVNLLFRYVNVEKKEHKDLVYDFVIILIFYTCFNFNFFNCNI